MIVINSAREPGLVRFTVPRSARSMLSGGTHIASEYVQPRISGDVALLKGIAKALIAQEQIDKDFIAGHINGMTRFGSS